MQFKKAFGFGPVANMFEALGVSKNDVIPVALLGLKAESYGKIMCEFLSPSQDGRRLCGIYEHRPGMCRLHPLGCVTIGGRRKWFFRKPLCDSADGKTHTVEGWLKESRARPYLEANARYLRCMKDLLERSGHLDDVTEDQWKQLEQILFDFDSIKAAGRINMDSIEAMFHDWLSQIKRI
jgi:Fe-S-cluster containining protein